MHVAVRLRWLQAYPIKSAVRHSCRQNELRGNPADLDGGDEEGVQLIGVGHKIAHRELQANLAKAASFIRRLQPDGWDPADLHPGGNNVRVYSQADLPLVGSVNAVGYSRARSRISYYVLYRLVAGSGQNEREEHWVAKVHSFLRLMPSEQQAGAKVLRLAVCDVYKRLKPLKDGTVFVINKTSLQHEQYALEVSGIVVLLVSAEPARPAAVPGMAVKRYFNDADVGKVFLTRFGNVSKMKAPL